MLWCHASLKNPQTKKAKFTIDDAGFRCKYGGHTSINHTGITTLTRLKQGSTLCFPGATLQLLSYGPGQFPSKAKAEAHMYILCIVPLYISRAKGGTSTQIHHRYIQVQICIHTQIQQGRVNYLSTMVYCMYYHHYRHQDSAQYE